MWSSSGIGRAGMRGGLVFDAHALPTVEALHLVKLFPTDPALSRFAVALPTQPLRWGEALGASAELPEMEQNCHSGSLCVMASEYILSACARRGCVREHESAFFFQLSRPLRLLSVFSRSGGSSPCMKSDDCKTTLPVYKQLLTSSRFFRLQHFTKIVPRTLGSREWESAAEMSRESKDHIKSITQDASQTTQNISVKTTVKPSPCSDVTQPTELMQRTGTFIQPC